METRALSRTSAPVASLSILPAEPGTDPAALHVVRPRWLTAYTATLVVLDGAAMAAATLTAKISWLGIDPESLHIRSISIPYVALTLATVPTWLVLVALAGGYDLGPFGSNPGAWTRVVRAGAQFLAVVAVAYYILHLAMLGRGVLAGTVPLAVLLTLVARGVARLALDQLRRRGHARRTALLVGSRPSIDRFLRQIDAHAAAGIAVVGETVIGEIDTGPPGHTAVAAIDAVAATGAESLIVTGGLAQGQLRDIAWALEGTGVELLVIPTPSDIEGLRSEIRPVAGLPLLHLDS